MRSRPRPPARPPTRVLLVSAHAPYRETVRQLLELEDDLTVVGEAATVAAALALAPEVRAEVVLTELPLPDGGGLALARALRTRWRRQAPPPRPPRRPLARAGRVGRGPAARSPPGCSTGCWPSAASGWARCRRG